MTEKKNIKTLNEALEYIDELEKGLQNAIEVVMKRDDQLSATEHRIFELESKMEDLEETVKTKRVRNSNPSAGLQTGASSQGIDNLPQ